MFHRRTKLGQKVSDPSIALLLLLVAVAPVRNTLSSLFAMKNHRLPVSIAITIMFSGVVFSKDGHSDDVATVNVPEADNISRKDISPAQSVDVPKTIENVSTST